MINLTQLITQISMAQEFIYKITVNNETKHKFTCIYTLCQYSDDRRPLEANSFREDTLVSKNPKIVFSVNRKSSCQKGYTFKLDLANRDFYRSTEDMEEFSSSYRAIAVVLKGHEAELFFTISDENNATDNVDFIGITEVGNILHTLELN